MKSACACSLSEKRKEDARLSEFLEGFMMFCFALSWPASIYTSWKTKKNDGKSIVFLYLVWIGDVAGLIAKIIAGQVGLCYIYAQNTLLVSIDMMLYYRNRRLEKQSLIIETRKKDV